VPKQWLYLMPLVLSTTLLSAPEEAEQPALPTTLAVTEVITMTDADESYVSTSLQYFKLPDQKRWDVVANAAYGLTDRWRVYAEIPYAFVEPREGLSTHGIGDVETSVRYSAVDYRRSPFGLDVGLGLSWPTGDHSRGLGDGSARIVPSLTASQWLGPVNVQLNLAWEHALGDSEGEPVNVLEHNLAVIYPVRRGYLVLEGNGETSGGQTSYCITPEVVWKASEHVQLTLAAPIGVTAAAGDYGLIAGCTIEIEHLFHRGGAKD
jgi:hypothetical protein